MEVQGSVRGDGQAEGAKEAQIWPVDEDVSPHAKEASTAVGQLWLLPGQKEAAAYRSGKDLFVDLRE